MKNIWKLIGALALLVGVVCPNEAANTCAATDYWCYQSGPSQSVTTTARLDASGNMTLAGNEAITGSQTVTGKSIFPVGTQINITSMTTIVPTGTYMLLGSSGNIVTVGGTISAISTATATDGQLLILGSSVAVNTVGITSGTLSGCDLGAATRTVGYGKRLGLLFSSSVNQWIELFYGSN